VKGKDLQKAIIGLARTHGWRVAHTPPILAAVRGKGGTIEQRWMTPVQADGKGFPDLLLLRERPLAIEVKGAGDKLRPEQSTWLSAFRMAGVEAYVITEADWPDKVSEILRHRVPNEQRSELAFAVSEDERGRAA